MARAEPKWETYRSFLAVMTEGSLSAAARKLGLTQPTLGRHIDELEADLGLKLFTRSQTGLIATQAARELVPHAQAMASAAEALVRASSGAGAEERGTVRLTASVFIGGEVLPDILARFREKHPRIAIELILSDQTQDLLRRDADIAVRMVQPKQEALVAKKIGKTTLGLFARRDYLERPRHAAHADEVSQHAVIGFDREDAFLRGLQAMGLALSRDTFALRVGTTTSRGPTPCAPATHRRLPDRRGAARPRSRPSSAQGLQLRSRPLGDDAQGLRGTRRMRLLFDHLAEELTAYAATSR